MKLLRVLLGLFVMAWFPASQRSYARKLPPLPEYEITVENLEAKVGNEPIAASILFADGAALPEDLARAVVRRNEKNDRHELAAGFSVAKVVQFESGFVKEGTLIFLDELASREKKHYHLSWKSSPSAAQCCRLSEHDALRERMTIAAGMMSLAVGYERDPDLTAFRDDLFNAVTLSCSIGGETVTVAPLLRIPGSNRQPHAEGLADKVTTDLVWTAPGPVASSVNSALCEILLPFAQAQLLDRDSGRLEPLLGAAANVSVRCYPLLKRIDITSVRAFDSGFYNYAGFPYHAVRAESKPGLPSPIIWLGGLDHPLPPQNGAAYVDMLYENHCRMVASVAKDNHGPFLTTGDDFTFEGFYFIEPAVPVNKDLQTANEETSADAEGLPAENRGILIAIQGGFMDAVTKYYKDYFGRSWPLRCLSLGGSPASAITAFMSLSDRGLGLNGVRITPGAYAERLTVIYDCELPYRQEVIRALRRELYTSYRITAASQ